MKKIICCLVFAQLVGNLYGIENKHTEKLENPDTSLIIAVIIPAQLDDIDNATINRNQTTRATCPIPFSIQNYVNLYGPFTMATANNGQILDFNKDNITSIYGLQNITNYDVVSVRLIGNCIAGNIVDGSFPDTPFQGVPNTIEIRLAQNHLESLPATFLSGLDQIAYITLGNNQLSSFPDGFFSGHDLIYLGINNNYFSSVDTIDISGMPSLQTFAFNNNYITSIPADYFQNNPALTEIYLNKNSLTDWPTAVLNNNSYVAYLDLSYNALADFQPDYIPANSNVFLTGNLISTSVQDEIQAKYPNVNFTF